MGRAAEVFFQPETIALTFYIARFRISLFPPQMLPRHFGLGTRETAIIKHGNLFEKNEQHLFFLSI